MKTNLILTFFVAVSISVLSGCSVNRPYNKLINQNTTTRNPYTGESNPGNNIIRTKPMTAQERCAQEYVNNNHNVSFSLGMQVCGGR